MCTEAQSVLTLGRIILHRIKIIALIWLFLSEIKLAHIDGEAPTCSEAMRRTDATAREIGACQSRPISRSAFQHTDFDKATAVILGLFSDGCVRFLLHYF